VSFWGWWLVGEGEGGKGEGRGEEGWEGGG